MMYKHKSEPAVWRPGRRRSLIALVTASVTILLLVTGVAAHSAGLVRSEPRADAVISQAPAQVKLWFVEELQSASSLQVFDQQGQPVAEGRGGVDLTDPDHATMLVKLPALVTGAYTVCWRAVLIDGDATAGEFVFRIGDNRTQQTFFCPTAADPGEARIRISWGWLIAGGLGLLLTTVAGWVWAKPPLCS